MSLLASETQNKVEACRTALAAVERHLDPLLAFDPAEVHRPLAPLESAELQVSLAYAAASLYFCHLLTQGVDPNSHPLKQELSRIQHYFKKVRTTAEEAKANAAEREHAKADAELAAKVTQHYRQAAEAFEQQRSEARARTGPEALPAPGLMATAGVEGEADSTARAADAANSAGEKVVAAEGTVPQRPRKKRRKAHRQEPVASAVDMAADETVETSSEHTVRAPVQAAADNATAGVPGVLPSATHKVKLRRASCR